MRSDQIRLIRSGHPDSCIRNAAAWMRLSACVALQKEVWNFTDAELVPLRMFVVAEKIGGQVIGAFDGGKLVPLRCRCRARVVDILSSFADAGGAELHTATPAWDGSSNSFSGKTLWPADLN